jgi:hypothetical protein
MTTAREALLELQWSRGKLAEATIAYVHRGAPGDEATVRGSDILALRRSFFDLRSGASIPYHRVLRIQLEGTLVWERHPQEDSRAET